MPSPDAAVSTSERGGLTTKRAAITTAALDLFVRQGFAATSLDDVATAAAVSRQTVYNHFGDKERLFLAVLSDELTATLHTLRTAADWPPDQVQNPQAAERYLTEVARRVMAAFYAPRTAAVRLLVQSEAPRHPAALRLWREHATTPVWSPLVGNLARLAHAGALDLPDPVRAAGQFVTLVTGTTWQMTEFGTFATTDITQANPVELEQALLANIRLFVRGHAPATTTVQ